MVHRSMPGPGAARARGRRDRITGIAGHTRFTAPRQKIAYWAKSTTCEIECPYRSNGKMSPLSGLSGFIPLCARKSSYDSVI